MKTVASALLGVLAIAMCGCPQDQQTIDQPIAGEDEQLIPAEEGGQSEAQAPPFDDPARLELNDYLRASCPTRTDVEIRGLLLQTQEGRLLGFETYEQIDAYMDGCEIGAQGILSIIANCQNCILAITDQVYRGVYLGDFQTPPLDFEPAPPETTPPPPPPAPDEPPPFVSGDLFSFLTPEETDFFRSRVASLNQQIDRDVGNELALILQDLVSRGFSTSSLALSAQCDAATDRVRLYRVGTRFVLEEVADIFGFQLYPFSAAEIRELRDFNCGAYPNETITFELSGRGLGGVGVLQCRIELPCFE